MTQKKLHLLKALSNKSTEDLEYSKWTIEGLEDSDVEELEEQGLIIIEIGDGYMGGHQTLSLTQEGLEFIDSYCEVCECMPCDCDWGYE